MMKFPMLEALANKAISKDKLENLGQKAVKKFIDLAAQDPDGYGMDSSITAREVKRCAKGYATEVEVMERGYHFSLIIDFDECGGDSYNHQDAWVSFDGKTINFQEQNFGSVKNTIDLQK